LRNKEISGQQVELGIRFWRSSGLDLSFCEGNCHDLVWYFLSQYLFGARDIWWGDSKQKLILALWKIETFKRWWILSRMCPFAFAGGGPGKRIVGKGVPRDC